MAKFVTDSAMDALLAYIATGTHVAVCSAQPTTYAQVATYKLAEGTITAGDGNGDWTIADGDSSGRKVTLAQQADLSIDTSGTATHVAVDDGSSELLLVTTCTSQALTSGGTVTVPSFKDEVADAA